MKNDQKALNLQKDVHREQQLRHKLSLLCNDQHMMDEARMFQDNSDLIDIY